MSFEELVYVALGSLIRRWVSQATDIDLSTQFLVELYSYFKSATFGVDWSGTNWIDLLASASEIFLKATGDTKTAFLQLIRCGSRRYPLFMDDPLANHILGFSTPYTLLHMLTGVPDRVQILRNIAKDFADDRRLMIIQCRSDRFHGMFELASVEKLPSSGLSLDPIRDGVVTHTKYMRWMHQSQRKIMTNYGFENGQEYVLNEDYTEHRNSDDDQENESRYLDTQIPYLYNAHGHQWRDPPASLVMPLLEAACSDQVELSDWQVPRGVTMRSTLAFGHQDIAALYYVSINYWTSLSPNDEPKVVGGAVYRVLPNIVVIRHVLWAFQRRLVDPQRLLTHFADKSFSWKLLRALKALSTAASLYQNLRSATVELRAAEQPLFDHQWLPQETRLESTLFGHVFSRYSLGREHKFACVAKFDSGTFNFHASAMNGVLAISSGNCIYVSSCLLQDPCVQDSNETIERVVGNLGKTGMCLLVCPAVPQVRSVLEDIRLVNHNSFDGKEEDCFAESSLHLSFTEWQLPIDVGSRGNRDVQASYVEAAIGVYDRSKWVADLNILDVFNPQLCRIIPGCTEHRPGEAMPIERLSEFVSIDCWEELLDSPTEVGVVRAKGNWQARLAAAALAIQRGHETRIVPDKICWSCCLALKTLPDTKESANQDTDMVDDSIGQVEWLSDDDGSDSESEDMVAALLRRTAGNPNEQNARATEQSQCNASVNRNILYII